MRRTTVAQAQEWTVGPAAQAVGTTVRTLHHYDAIALVTPSGRTAAGYRVYLGPDLDRLRRVLVWRELGFTLEQTADLLDGGSDVQDARLREQLAAVGDRIDRLQQVQAALEREVEARMDGNELTQADKRELFGEGWSENEADYAAEAEQRWGGTDAWAQARAREASYTKADWRQIKADNDDLNRRFAALLRAGEPADGPAARELAEEHRQLITRWHYDCSLPMHAGLGRMYEQDERFARTYEAVAPGLAAYVSAAVQANAAARA